MAFIDGIKEKAKRDRKTIVLPETNDKRTLQAANEIIRDGIADLILVGDQEKILDGARWLDLDYLDRVRVINPQTTPKLDEYVNLLYETRKAKGMTPERHARHSFRII